MKALEKLLKTIDNRIAFLDYQDYLSDTGKANLERWRLAKQLVETAEGPENIQFLRAIAEDKAKSARTADGVEMWTEFLELVKVTENMAGKEENNG